VATGFGDHHGITIVTLIYVYSNPNIRGHRLWGLPRHAIRSRPKGVKISRFVDFLENLDVLAGSALQGGVRQKIGYSNTQALDMCCTSEGGFVVAYSNPSGGSHSDAIL